MAEYIEREEAMDVREKLIEILRKPIFPHELVDPTEAVADYLLDNGVTVQEWISVTESPKRKGCYIVAVNHWLDGKPVTREAYWNGCDWLSCDKKRELTPRVTHWMPLPEPPKGE